MQRAVSWIWWRGTKVSKPAAAQPAENVLPYCEETVSPQLLRQRIRENMIDYFEVASSAEEQLHYQRTVPIAHVPAEMIEQWADSAFADDFDWYSSPVFSDTENAAIRRFQLAWEGVAADTPRPLPGTVEALLGTEPWGRLMAGARNALAVFEQRGRFSRDHEEPLAKLTFPRTPV